MTASETEHFKYYEHGDAVRFVLKADPSDIWSTEDALGTFTEATLREMLSVFEPPEDEDVPSGESPALLLVSLAVVWVRALVAVRP